MKFKRIFTIVIDSVGIGESPDANIFNDIGANTLGNTANAVNGLNLPNMEKLGLGNIHQIKGVAPNSTPKGFYTKMQEASNGKDTLTGHWELMGLHVDKPFITFTETGFPKELISMLEEKSGRKIIGNIAASGTEIIKDLGEEHMNTGAIIVYTSADSVLQIAAHEKIVPLDELYSICEIARELTLRDEWRVGRIIARPFLGDNSNNFTRTPNRHDYALSPSSKTALDYLKDNNYDVLSVGKINDIFNANGITKAYKTKSNTDGMNQTINLVKKDFTGLCFTNLVDFDSLYGHRRNPTGYAKCLEEFDKQLSILLNNLEDNDLLIITADHGNDPTMPGTDHTREFVPLLAYNKKLNGGILPVRKTFADVGATILDNFKIISDIKGTSFLNELN